MKYNTNIITHQHLLTNPTYFTFFWIKTNKTDLIRGKQNTHRETPQRHTKRISSPKL